MSDICNHSIYFMDSNCLYAHTFITCNIGLDGSAHFLSVGKLLSGQVLTRRLFGKY